MLQWYDGKSWEHRAYWGRDYIGQQISNMGVRGTEYHRFMGGMPTSVGWHRLEVPASYVGLEGKSVSGMAFTVYRDQNNPRIAWDYSGKSPQLTAIPLPLSATTGAYRFYSSSDGWAYDTNEVGPAAHTFQKKDVFFVDPKQAAGTVPMYRFHNQDDPYTHFYARCKECYDGHGWIFDNVAFYVFADGSTPGTVPLYLYHDAQFHYLLTTDQNEAAGMTLDGIWAYVYPNTLPVRPSLSHNICCVCGDLSWTSSSANVTGFKIERRFGLEGPWTQIATAGADLRSYFASCAQQSSSQSTQNPDPETATSSAGGWSVYFRIRAASQLGDSPYSNEVVYHSCPSGAVCPLGEGVPPNHPPEITIASPSEGDILAQDFAITGNAFDIDGAGTVAKVEFFANGNKLGEVTSAPYVFPWNNVASGTYSLTATVTDAAGATATSAPVSVTVGKANQTIAFDAIADKTYGDASFAVSAGASSGLPVSFTITSGPATVSGSTVTLNGAGTVTVRASQSG